VRVRGKDRALRMPLPSDRPEPPATTTGYVPVAETIADGLRQDILEWRLRPGDRIPQEAVARRYRASRLPVRQALDRLQMEGLVTFTSHAGARVSTLAPADLDEIYKLRERLEPLAILESVPHLTEDQLDELAHLARELEEVGGSDPPRWIGLDRRFHLLACAAAPLPRLRREVGRLWNAVQPYRPAYTGRPETVDAALREHRHLLASAARRDAEAAANVVEAHIRRTRLEVLSRLDRSTDVVIGTE
jgi:DNA-binding GntR family transcriptional regulator